MSDETRVLAHASPVRREDARCDRTHLVLDTIDRPLPLETLFERHAAQMTRELLAETRPGVMVFALGPYRIEGTMWLRATGEYRAGSIGRHGQADLFLDAWDTVSLRHCLVLVRQSQSGPRIHLLDLSSSNGLMLEDGSDVRAVDSDGFMLLRMAEHGIAVVPTGAPLPWTSASPGGFRALGPREVVPVSPERPSARFGSELAGEPHSTQTARLGPMEAGKVPLCLSDEAPAGRLTLLHGRKRLSLLIGGSALDRGVLLGRDRRCEGRELLSDIRVSRVHAMVIRRDGVVMVADAGSTNGMWIGDDEVRCVDVTAGATVEIARFASATWMPLD